MHYRVGVKNFLKNREDLLIRLITFSPAAAVLITPSPHPPLSLNLVWWWWACGRPVPRSVGGMAHRGTIQYNTQWHTLVQCGVHSGTVVWHTMTHSGTMCHTVVVHSGGSMVRPQRAICYSATALCSLIYSYSYLCIPRQSGVPAALHQQAGSSCQSQSQSSSSGARFHRLSCKSLLLPQSRCQSTLSTLFYQHSRHQTANRM